MTSPQGPARDERWQVEELPDVPDPPFSFLISRGYEHRLYVSTQAGVVLADYLNALERERDHLLDRSTEFEMQLTQAELERDAYRQALEKIAEGCKEDPYTPLIWAQQFTDEALALSSAGRETR